MRSANVAVVIAFLLLFAIGLTAATPLEITISQRYSARSYTDQLVTSQQLQALLRASYGYSGSVRVLPKIGEAYSLTVFSVNSSGSYIYMPETNSVAIWDASVTKETIRPRLTQDWENNATVIVVIVWNQTKMNNQYFAYAEAGCLVQNFYLAAADLALGTCCAQTFDSEGLRSDLKLPNTMVPLLIMPTGFPLSQYPNATPDYSRMSRNLPPVQNSAKTFKDVLGNLKYAQNWSAQTLSLQEQSQLLWAAYGYSSTGHRSTPSWGGWYPLIVYVANVTGTFCYSPETHSLSEIQTGDKRSVIAAACGNQHRAADAPAIFILAYNSTVNTIYPEPGWYDLSVEVDAGCVVQQILLESSALGLCSNVVTSGIGSWNGSSAQALRDNLNLTPSLVPLFVLPVGHASTPDSTVPDSTSPDSTSPDSTSPDSTLPDSTIPDSTIPDSTSPDSTVPDSTVPDSTSPDSTQNSPLGILEYSLIFAGPVLIALISLGYLVMKRKSKLGRSVLSKSS
jgi:nitroreductase